MVPQGLLRIKSAAHPRVGWNSHEVVAAVHRIARELKWKDDDGNDDGDGDDDVDVDGDGDGGHQTIEEHVIRVVLAEARERWLPEDSKELGVEQTMIIGSTIPINFDHPTIKLHNSSSS